jgi:acyl-CoA thioester hydrolase
MIEHTTEFRVRYAETDQMGIAHHSNYVIWFELARVRLMESVGISYKGLEKDGFQMPVLDVKVRYIKYAEFDDVLKVRAMIKDKPGAKINYSYEITNTANEILCTGSTQHAFMNDRNRAIKPPKDFMLTMNKLFKRES